MRTAASADGATFDVADPVTNLPYASVAAGGPEDIDRAVTAASTAFTDGPWPGLPARRRASILNRSRTASRPAPTGSPNSRRSTPGSR